MSGWLRSVMPQPLWDKAIGTYPAIHNSLLSTRFRGSVILMESHLSPQNEQYLERVVAGGLYPSKDAALDAAVAALREKIEDLPFVLDEHMEAVEQAIDEADAGHSRPMTDDDWSRLRSLAHNVAAGKTPGNA